MALTFITKPVLLLAVALRLPLARAETPVLDTNITLPDIERAQKTSGAALIKISSD